MNQPAPQFIRAPKEPPRHVMYAHRNGRGALTFEQVEELVKAINPAFVQSANNKAYLAQHQARAEMNRIFGYGNWDSKTDSMTLAYEERIEQGHPSFPRNGKGDVYWISGYEGAVTVVIRDLWGMPLAEYREFHFEENAPQPNRGEARALALTSVESYALRRSLINLGDRFGLGLYNKGSQAPHGIYTIQLQGGVMFDWQPASGQQPQVAAPQQVTHETIPAEPVLGDDNTMPENPGVPSDYDDAEPDGQGGVRSRTHAAKMQQFHAAQASVQQQRDAARQQPQQPQQQGAYPPPTGGAMARLQQGFKVDQRPTPDDADFNSYGNEQHPAGPTSAQEAQFNG